MEGVVAMFEMRRKSGVPQTSSVTARFRACASFPRGEAENCGSALPFCGYAKDSSLTFSMINVDMNDTVHYRIVTLFYVSF